MTHTWFITGTSSGLGLQLTELLLDRGDRVAATLRHPTVLDDLKLRYGEKLWTASLDVTDTPAIRRVVDKAFAELGRIDVVVNNAGYVLFGATEEVSDEQLDWQISTNLIGSIQVTRAVLPYMRGQGGGRIIQISSMGGQAAYPVCSIYHATKWGIEGFTEALMQEVAAFGIQLTIVEPGAMLTSFGDNAVQADIIKAYEDSTVGEFRRRSAAAGPARYPGDPRKIAQVIIDLAAQGKAPKRLTLGKDAYQVVHAALSERLAAIESQKELAAI